MVVVIQSKNAVIETHSIIKATTDKEGGVYATCENNLRETLGHYQNLQAAKFALDMYANALASGDRLFYFPDEIEVKNRMTVRKGKTAKSGVSNSHGGS